jgi:hypothetical protein
VAHRSVSAGDCLFGAGGLADSPFHLRHYINRRVGVKLPQHSLILHCFAAKFLVIAEEERAAVEETDSEDDYNSAVPSKPSHLDFGKSTISEADFPKMVKLGYLSEAKKELIRFGGEETIPKPRKNEVVVFKSLFKAGLRFPLNKMIAGVLKKYGIYLHQLTPNTIVRLSVYIWALRSQGWNHSPKVSAEYTNCTTKPRLGEMVCMKILAATTLLTAKLQSSQ